METSETEYEENGERERTAEQQTISLFDFETLQKTKISPCWRADRSGP